MAPRLTDLQKKNIVADYVELGSYNAVAKLHGISINTVKKIVLQNEDVAELCNQKKEENAADILAYMEQKRELVCEIIGKGLAALNSPEKLAEASPAQITTALGTLIDKWTMVGPQGDHSGGVVVLSPVMDDPGPPIPDEADADG